MATDSRAAMQRWSVPGRLREAFLGGDRATARVYLQNLVDHIVVDEDEIIIEARAGAALAMMSAPGVTDRPMRSGCDRPSGSSPDRPSRAI